MNDTTGPISLDATIAAWVQAAQTATAEIARLTEIRDRAIEHIKNPMGDAEEALIGDKPAVSWAWSKPAPYIDRKGLEADYPKIAAKYTKLKQPARPFKILPAAE